MRTHCGGWRVLVIGVKHSDLLATLWNFFWFPKKLRNWKVYSEPVKKAKHEAKITLKLCSALWPIILLF